MITNVPMDPAMRCDSRLMGAVVSNIPKFIRPQGYTLQFDDDHVGSITASIYRPCMFIWIIIVCTLVSINSVKIWIDRCHTYKCSLHENTNVQVTTSIIQTLVRAAPMTEWANVVSISRVQNARFYIRVVVPTPRLCDFGKLQITGRD